MQDLARYLTQAGAMANSLFAIAAYLPVVLGYVVVEKAERRQAHRLMSAKAPHQITAGDNPRWGVLALYAGGSAASMALGSWHAWILAVGWWQGQGRIAFPKPVILHACLAVVVVLLLSHRLWQTVRR